MVENQHTLHLNDRKTLLITGDDASHFLHNLITSDVENLDFGAIIPGALLSPQGKVLFDFLIGKTKTGYLIDIDELIADAFKKRLSLYKLRSKVDIVESKQRFVTVCWQNDSNCLKNESCFQDKRFPDNEKVVRCYSENPGLQTIVDLAKWQALRIRYGVAQSGDDFTLGDVFPHDINYDQTGGLSFKKGCYIGQEVISRMHHRATARRRMMVVEAVSDLPAKATLTANGKPLGELATVVGNKALALMRIDRVKNAIDNGQAIMADDITVKVSIAENMKYGFPESHTES